jgi:diketogulonate reductase-like aldo/keto reductase
MSVPTFTLNNGVTIPVLGYGVFQTPPDETVTAVETALRKRIAENFDVFGFDLAAEQLAAIGGLDTGIRGGPEPEDVTREKFGRDIPEA